jgi:hypothetical protein
MKICVFCGSSPGHDPAYSDGAARVARVMAQAGARYLVEREIVHRKLHHLHEVETMHDRKTKMSALADAFLALPGGAGTLEEILEQWTWGQLGIHSKPCALLNINGYFDPLRMMIDRMVREGFLNPRFAEMLIVSDDIDAVLAAFRSYVAPPSKW